MTVNGRKNSPLVAGLILLGVVWTCLLVIFPFGEIARELVRLIVIGGTLLSPFFGIACFIFFLPLLPSRYESVQLGFGIPDLTWQRFFILVLLVSLVMHLAVRRKVRERFVVSLSQYDKIIILYALLLFASLFVGSHLKNALQYYVTMILIPFAYYYLTRIFIVDWNRVKIFLTTIMVSATLVALVMIYQGITKTNYFYNLWYPNIVLGAPPESLEGIYRASGIIGNHNSNGLILAMTWVIGIFLYRVSRSKVLRAFCLAYFLISIPAIFYTYSRKTWIGLLIIFVVSFWSHRRRKYLIPLGMICVGVVFLHHHFISAEVMQERILAPNTLLRRYDLARIGWRMFLDSPVIGQGFNEYRYLWPKFGSDIEGMGAETKAWVAHNSFLTLLCENGVIGLALFLVTVCYPLYYATKLKRAGVPIGKEMGDYLNAMKAICLLFLFTALGMNVFEGYWNNIYYFSLIAISLNMSGRSAAESDRYAAEGAIVPYAREGRLAEFP